MIAAFARWFGYSTWFVAALLASLYWSIPRDDIRRLVQHRATERLKTKVTIDDIAFHGVTGVSLLGIKVILPVKKTTPPETPSVPGAPAAEPTPGATEGDKAAPEEAPKPLLDVPGLLLADSVRVDVNTFGLLMGRKLKAKLAAEISGGTIGDTAFEKTSEGWTLHVGELAGIDLGPIKVLRTLGKMDLDLLARLSGKLDVTWGGALDKSRGELELTLTDTVLPYLPIKDPRQPFPIGEAFEVKLGTIELEATLDKTEKLPGVRPRPGATVTLLIEKLSARGEHLELQLDGGQKHTISFTSGPTGEAEVDVTLVLSFTDAFFAWKGEGHRPDGESIPDASHEGLKMGLEAGLRAARTVIGQRSYYGFHCQGRLKDFKCLPKAPSRRLTPMAPSEPASGGARPAAPEHSPENHGGDDAASARPAALQRPARPGTRPNLPTSPRVAQPMPGATRGVPRVVEPTRPEGDPLDAARVGTPAGAPGDTLGPGVAGGTLEPAPEAVPEAPPVEEPVAAETVPEGEPVPAEGEPAPAEGGEAPPDEAVDGADGAPPEGGEELPEEQLE